MGLPTARLTPMPFDRLPLLRAPPFADVSPAVAAVSEGPCGTVVPGDGEVDAVLAGVRAACVGGTFWASATSHMSDTVARLRPYDDRAALTRTLPASTLWLEDEADPWSLLTPGRTLVAHGDDEWVAIATLAGTDVRLLSNGRFAAADDGAAERRRRVAAHLLACRYRDPFTAEPCTIGRTIEILALWRGVIAANRDIVAAAGMAWWKRKEIRHFLWAPRGSRLPFRRAHAAMARAARLGGSVAVWPSRISDGAVADAARRGVSLVRVEDGFVRSVGLGANLVPPLSVTVDRLGIHYDPSGPSELERLIEAGDFPPALIARAAALRRRIVAERISKYGGAAEVPPPARRPDRKLVLVPGQVEDDQSVVLGGSMVAGNLDLLRRVRAAEPDAEIWFRPHPDVDAGHRRGGVGDADALRHVDRVVRGESMATLLATVDAVHVLTSLTGFEALLRGRDVVCHGIPFFAGWGLTWDLAAIPDRRSRHASLDELVAATLILYPRYLDPRTMLPCPPEVLIDRLTAAPKSRPSPLVRLRQLQGRLLRLI